METILVTGGLGYIGSHTVVELLHLGYKVVVIDNLSNARESVKENISSITNKTFDWINGDVNSEQDLVSIFTKYAISGVIHFAAYKAVGESVEHPIKYYQNNINGLITLLKVMDKFKVSNLIFSSSCTVYGGNAILPVTENSPIQEADSPYGTTKIIGEQLIKDFAKHKSLKAVLLRYFNPVGAHPTAKIGELPLGVPNNLVPYITQTAAGIRPNLTIHGQDYNTPDGTAIRDYIHVVDLANAHVKAYEYAQKMTQKVDVFNVGTGNGNSVLDVVKTFEKVNNIVLHYTIGPRRAGDVEQIFAETTKVNKELGWVPQKSLEDMMRDAWMWQCSLGAQ